MKQVFASFFVCSLFLGATTTQAKDLTIRWHGHSMFEIVSSKGANIVIDPHLIEGYRPRPVRADAVLVTHPHIDHNDFRSIRNASSVTKIEGITGTGRRARWNKVEEKKVKDFTITAIPGFYHDAEEGKKRGKMGVFLIEVDGFRIVHLGDLGHKLAGSQVKKLGQVDILMVPVGGIYTVNGSEAKDVVKSIKPRYAIFPCHYATEVYDYVLGPDEFLEDQKNVKKLKGNQWKIEVGAKAPDSPNIILMDWK